MTTKNKAREVLNGLPKQAQRKPLYNAPGPWPAGNWTAEQTLPGGLARSEFALFKRDDEYDHNNVVGHANSESIRNEIVTACNAHDELVAALRRTTDALEASDVCLRAWNHAGGPLDSEGAMNAARAALAKVQS